MMYVRIEKNNPFSFEHVFMHESIKNWSLNYIILTMVVFLTIVLLNSLGVSGLEWYMKLLSCCGPVYCVSGGVLVFIISSPITISILGLYHLYKTIKYYIKNRNNVVVI